MFETLDNGSLRVAAYLAVAAIAALWGARERRRPAHRDLGWWPAYWFSSAILLVGIGISRAGPVGDSIKELVRERAGSGGWYETRSILQAVAVTVVAAVWMIAAIAISRVSSRRRRYLPHAIAVSSLMVFGAVRLISLHQIDTVLYERDLGGIRIVAVIEFVMLAITALVAVSTASFEQSRPAIDSADRATVEAVDGGDSG